MIEPSNGAKTHRPSRPLAATPWRAGRRPPRGASPRAENLARALRCIADGDGEVSRADISARTALNRSTSSSLVDELIAAGLVCEVGVQLRSTAGRPPTSLALVDVGPAGVGIEIAADHLATCVVDLAGNARSRRVARGNQRGRSPEDVLRDAVVLGASAVREAEDLGLDARGVTLAVPGVVDVAGARVVSAPDLGWHDVAVDAVLDVVDLGIHPEAPVTVESTASCAALAERGLLRSRSGVLYLHAGSGLGSTLVLGGELYRGRHGRSGEVGHLTVEHEGLPCGCGGRGCLEQYAGREAVLREAGVTSTACAGDADSRLATEVLEERVAAGDGRARRAVERAGRAIGLAVTQVLTLLDLDLVVLGGFYLGLGPRLLPVVRAEVASRCVGTHRTLPTVTTASHGLEAPALGAARTVVQRIIDDPWNWLETVEPHRQRAAGR